MVSLRFLTSMGDEAFDQMISANEYFGFVTSLVLAMGAVFELPIAILLLSALGLVTPQFLSKFRRHAVVGSYLAAAIITPGDLFVTSVALMVPLYLLYELSIGLSWLVFRKRQRRAAAGDRQAKANAPLAGAKSRRPERRNERTSLAP